MGRGLLAFTVETLNGVHDGPHRLGDFARRETAEKAARYSLADRRVSLAVVRNFDGIMCFAIDRQREWSDQEGGDRQPA